MITQQERSQALLTAQQAYPEADWRVMETGSGGYQLVFLNNGGGLITLMMNPCPANLGEVGKPYQVNCHGIKNFETLDEALSYVVSVK